MTGSLRVGRIAGIRIELNLSWLFLLALLTGSLATGWFPSALPNHVTSTYWLAGFAAALLLFVSVLAHELGHSLVARAHHLPVHSITLFVFGGVSRLEQEPPTAGAELQVTIVGPAVSALLAAITWPAGLVLMSRFDAVGTVLVYLGVANVLLAAFNLIPAFPLDGGHVLRSALWALTDNRRRATRWASRVGQVFALLFILAGVWQLFHGRVIAGIWMCFIGLLLLNVARTTDAQVVLETLLRGVIVQDVMNPTPPTVPATMTLRELMAEGLIMDGARVVPVTRSNQFLGLVTFSDVRGVPEDQWEETLVGHVMIPLERVFAVSPDDPVSEALALMNAIHVDAFPVVQGWRLAGMLGRETAVRYLAARRGLPESEAARRIAGPVESLPRAG